MGEQRERERERETGPGYHCEREKQKEREKKKTASWSAVCSVSSVSASDLTVDLKDTPDDLRHDL